jgi:adenylate cyclase
MNGIGIFDFSLRPEPNINFHPRILLSVLSSTLHQPIEIQSISLMMMIVTGSLLSIILPVMAPIPASIITFVLCIPHYIIYMHSAETGLILPMEYSLIIILVLFSVNALFTYLTETHSRQQILQVFGQYLPPQIVNQISNHPEMIRMEGEAKHLTVFFCDLEGFSNLAEQLNPKQVVLLLNEYFEEMTDILFRHGATIDKYIGDAIMAFWGAPITQDDHAERAVLAALEMDEKIKELVEKFINRGWPAPTMCIGINTGIMCVGNMGSKLRIAYTVIGDAVNLASRIETLTRDYKVPILVSEYSQEECHNIVFREIDTVQVKGKLNLTKIFQPLCTHDQFNDDLRSKLELHNKAIDASTNGNYQTAVDLFTELKEKYPDDPYYPAMLTMLKERQKKNGD